MNDPSFPHFERRAACPGCDSIRTETIFRAPLGSGPLFEFLRGYYRPGAISQEKLAPASFVLDECLDCSLVFQRYIPDEPFLEEIYERWLNSTCHPTKDLMVADALAHPNQCRDGHELMAAASYLGRPLKGLRVLDYGMGWGLWARVAKALGCEVYGYDLSESRRAWAREHGVKVVDTHEFFGLELDFANTEQVFEHLSTPLADARVLAKSLRPGVILKVAVPRGKDLKRRLAIGDWKAPRNTRRSLNPVHPLEHLNCWSPRALGVMTDLVGLELVEVPLRSYLSFLKRPWTLSLTDPKQVAKAFLRPVYNWLNPHQLYRWFRKRLS